MARKPESRHLVMSILAGVLLGIGCALLLLVERVISLNSRAADLVVIGGAALGLLVGLAPARRVPAPPPPELADHPS